MELVNKKKSAEENISSDELQSVSEFQIVQNNSFSNLGLDLYKLQLLKQKYHVHQLLEY